MLPVLRVAFTYRGFHLCSSFAGQPSPEEFLPLGIIRVIIYIEGRVLEQAEETARSNCTGNLGLLPVLPGDVAWIERYGQGCQ